MKVLGLFKDPWSAVTHLAGLVLSVIGAFPLLAKAGYRHIIYPKQAIERKIKSMSGTGMNLRDRSLFFLFL